MARVFKEKYFPTTSFMAATLGIRPSYAWRSICKSRPLLKEGLFWHVGNGHSIKVWEYKWIPCPTTHMIQSHVNTLRLDATVSELIDGDSCWWNTTLIQSIFSLAEAQSICNLALSPGGLPNKLIWQGTTNGMFSVRSAYHLEKELRALDFGESSTPASTSVVWKTVCTLCVPGVVRTFIWRLCNNSLPTKVNLFNKKIVQDPLCPLCGVFPETLGHII